MQIILSDHNCEGQAEAIFENLRFDKTWLELAPMELMWFKQVGLSDKAEDEEVWRLCQERNILLLTGNRRSVDKERSLEYTILPVITIGTLKRVIPDLVYRQRCAERLAEIVYDLETLRGVMRIFIP